MMSSWTSWAWWWAMSVVASAAIMATIFRYFPNFVFSWLLKGIEHRNQIALEKFKSELSQKNALEAERLKGEISGAYSAIKSSVDFVSANQRELRLKMIESSESLWSVILKLRTQFLNVSLVENLLFNEEFNSFFVDKSGDLYKNISEYRDWVVVNKKMTEAGVYVSENHRLIVGDRLWLLFSVICTFNGRVAYLYSKSLNTGKYVNWREDNAIHSLLDGVLDKDKISSVLGSETRSFQMINSELENLFVKESFSLMSGMRAFKDTIDEVSSDLLR